MDLHYYFKKRKVMEKSAKKEQFVKMTNEPVYKLILKLAIPTIITMLTTSIYNMADTFYVSKLGTSASAAVGIVFSVMAIIQATGFTLGMGSSSLVSRKLGEKKAIDANKYASTAFISALIFGLLIAIFGTIFINPLMEVLGATPSILPFAKNYALYILSGAPIMCASFVLNNVLRAEGKAKFSMIGLCIGGVINIILDPIFIFTLNLGTKGAAIATLLSQIISFCILFQFFLRKKSIIQISLKYALSGFAFLLPVVATGLPSLCRQGLASISTVLLNRSASAFGDEAIAAMSITTRVIMLVASLMIGIGQGFTPVAGYNYGAKQYERVKDSYFFTVKLGFFVLLIFGTFFFIAAPQTIAFFIDDKNVIEIGKTTLRFQCVGLPLHALIVCTNMLMQSTGKIKRATFLSCNRQGVYFIPLITVLPLIWGLTGVQCSQAIADCLSAITAIPYAIIFIKELKTLKAK